VRIAIATDAWAPQINGVVRVLESLAPRLRELGHELLVVQPGLFRTAPCPTYPEIRLALLPGRRLAALLDGFAPDALHIATEGPLGWAARAWAARRRAPFTTAYHSKFPEYLHARTRLPLDLLYAPVRRFHAPSAGVLAPSASVRRELEGRGFRNVRAWAHGVDAAVFRPRGKQAFPTLPRPLFAYVGRVAVDKNLPAFLELDLPGSKLVSGRGPAFEPLKRRYPRAHFAFARDDEELATHFSAADVFVFPSLTDTFGLVMLEALACGVPVAAFPVTGPLDAIGASGAGVLDFDLRRAALAALTIPPERARAHAARFSWDEVARQFVGFLAPIRSAPRPGQEGSRLPPRASALSGGDAPRRFREIDATALPAAPRPRR
jgi:glycosyltransferase involved in cell wall biosynthesis